MSWRKVKLGELLTESRIPCENPNPDRRIKVRLKVLGVEKRGLENEIEGATKQFIRKAGQFIYGKQNFHKGAFGVIPKELDGFESSADLPAFDVSEKCLPEWIFYFFKQGNYYLELSKIARGVATQRIHPEQIFDLEIPLPDLKTQKELLRNVFSVEKNGITIDDEISHQQDLLKQLRQAFLREAMQGKLVKSEKLKVKSEGTGKELLEKIKEEKMNRIGLKPNLKMKTQSPALKGRAKDLPPIKEEEIPFDIPENWVWCRIGEVGDLKRGKSKHRPRDDQRLFEKGTYPFIQTGDVSKAKFNKDLITTVNNYYSEFGLKQSEIQKKGTLCITIAANIAECGFLDFDACVPDSIVCFSAIEKTIDKFVYYYLKIAKDELERFAPATAQKNINLGILNEFPIPLPPLAEQKRIVKKLEELMNLCEELKTTITDNQTYTHMLLQVALKDALQMKEVEVIT